MSLPGMGRDRESLCSLFHACDVDHSGQIEKYEFIQICSELNVPPTEREHIFSKLDTDRDGTINLAEFISGFLGISEQVYCGNMESESWEVSSPAWEDFQTRLGDHAKFIPSLRRLEVFGCLSISPSCLNTVSELCPGLETLNIGQIPKVTHPYLTLVTSRLKRLQALNLTGLHAVSDQTVHQVLLQCPELQRLTLSSCPGVTDMSLHKISTHTPHIRLLDLSGCGKVSDAGVKAVAVACRCLQYLDLSSTATGTRGVSLLAKYCSTHLHTVKLSFCQISPEAIHNLSRQCKRLKLLHLYGCAYIPTEKEIRDINPTVTLYPLT